MPKPDSLVGYEEISGTETQSFLDALRQENQKLQSARMLFKATLKKGLNKQEVKEVLVFNRPGEMRIDFFATGMNRLVSILLLKDTRLQSLNVEERVLSTGEATVENIFRILSVPFLPEELMLWSAGRFLIPVQHEVGTMKVLKNNGASKYVLQLWLLDGRFLQAFFTAEVSSSPKMVSLELKNAVENTVYFYSNLSYEDGKNEDNKGSQKVGSNETPIPHKIEFWLPGKEVSGVLLREQYAINPEIEPQREKLFSLPNITGVKTIDLDR